MEISATYSEVIEKSAAAIDNGQPNSRLDVGKAPGDGARSEEVAAGSHLGNCCKGGAEDTPMECPGMKVGAAPIAPGAVMEANGYQFLGP